MKEFSSKPPEQAMMLGEDLTLWENRIDELIGQDAHIITIRGAGAVNGIEPDVAEAATVMLYDYTTALSDEGHPVVLMFDGDEDNREQPDIGAVFGTLVDSLEDNPSVTAICAQLKSWYYPENEGDNLKSYTGTAYETYVFDDSVPGKHTALTQSDTLANCPDYEQFFVGAAGEIAYGQLADLNQKASDQPVKVTILKAPINPDPTIDEKLASKLENATKDNKANIQSKIDQRAELPYGTLFTQDGDLKTEISSMPGIEIETLTVDPNKVTRGTEVLYPNKLKDKMDRALQHGTPDDLKSLLDDGMSVDQQDWQGRTALMLYASRGDAETVEMLIERGADVNRIYMYQDRKPMTALDAAQQTGNQRVAEMLATLGAKSGKELG